MRLERNDGERWLVIAQGTTSADGRATLVADGAPLPAGRYRLDFALAPYFAAHSTPAFFPEATLVFEVAEANGRFHVPLLLSPYGYSTYRGS